MCMTFAYRRLITFPKMRTFIEIMPGIFVEVIGYVPRRILL